MSKGSVAEIEPVSREKIAELERASVNSSEAPGNVMKLLTTHLPDELAAKIRERDNLVAKLKAMNLEIALITTHCQLAEPA